MMRPVAIALAVALGFPAPALAQSAPSSPPRELPVSLARIKRALDQPPPSKTLDGLKLSYYVSVTAENPPINLFKDFKIKDGLGRYAGPPTPAELLAQNTPEEFRSPPADLTAIVGWLGTTIYKKARHRD